MKKPNKDLLTARMLAVEQALDKAVQVGFKRIAADQLAQSLSALRELVFEDGEEFPIFVEGEEDLRAKVLITHDVTYACWLNDEPEVPLPDDIYMSHAARMKMNYGHCYQVVEFARMFLGKHGRLMSPELALLGGMARQHVRNAAKGAGE
jgi:hypothetical protein